MKARSTPLNSKTMWTIYVGQVSLGLGLHQTLSIMGPGTPTSVLLAFVAMIGLVAMVGVLGISVVDRAVAMVDSVWGGDKPASPPDLTPQPQKPDAEPRPQAPDHAA